MGYGLFFLTKFLAIGIVFSTAARAVEVAKLVMPKILHLTSFILALRVVLVAKLLISGVLSSVFLNLTLYTSFLTTSFLLHYLVYLNQHEQALIYQHLLSTSFVYFTFQIAEIIWYVF